MDTYRYSLREHTGHLLVELPEGTVLVDTGSPVSIGQGGTLSFAGHEVALLESYQGATPADLSRELGTEVSFLLGMDAMRDRDVHFDLGNGMLELLPVPGECPADGLPLKLVHGVPALKVQVVGGRTLAGIRGKLQFAA